MTEEKIETLLANAGNKPGEAIGNYGRSIVFLPKEVKPGESVRVALREIREDSRGTMMYRGVAAPDEVVHRWKDNGDGTASRMAHAIDWRLARRELGVEGTKRLEKREGAPRERSNLSVVWGADQASSFIEDRSVRLFPLEEEFVASDGTLAWKKVGERSEQLPPVRHALVRVAIQGGSLWHGGWAKPVFASDATLSLALCFAGAGGGERSFTAEYAWGTLPAWYRAEIEARFPLCACGRQRINSAEASQPRMCEQCAVEQICDACGAKGKVEEVGSRHVCSTCKPLVAQEELIERLLPKTRREELSALARKLVAVEPVPQEAGEIILRATADHIPAGWDRDAALEKQTGYPWYYFVDDGVYGSKFPRGALQVLAHYAAAAGNGLVELTAWLVGDARGGESDYFVRTQVEGESLKPSLRESSLANLAVAVRVRGSEADRLKALESLKALEAKPEAKELIEGVRGTLFGSEANYAAVVAKVAEVEAELARRREDAAAGRAVWGFEAGHRRGGVSFCGDGWVIRPDGSRRERDSDDVPRYKRDGTYRWTLVAAEELALRWSCVTTRDVSGTSKFEVVKLPASGELTPAQLETVRAIEAEISAPQGAFGLDAEATALFERRMTAIRRACDRSRILREAPSRLDYRSVCGSNGLGLLDTEVKGERIERWIDWHAQYDQRCDGRDAAVLEAFSAADGMFEILAYDKYGRMNLALRWRPLREEEQKPPEPAAPLSKEVAPPVSPEAVKALDTSKLFGGMAKARKGKGR